MTKAVCEYCGKVMLDCDGCEVTTLIMNDDKEYDRIPVGAEGDLYYGYADEGFRCRDCNASYGTYHHSGCDAETCPKCHEQLLDCDC